MYEVECVKCHETYELDEIPKSKVFKCNSCKRRNGASIYFNIGILILGLGFVGGFVLGYYYSCNMYNTVVSNVCPDFNLTVALYSWLSCAFMSSIFFAIYSICYRLNVLIDKE